MNNDRFKFRVWDKENECYQQDEADHCVINHKGELVCVFWGDGDTMQTQYVESKNVVIEQCTGLKDKNGKLIYEGDIVQDVEYSRPNPLIYKITWGEKACGFRMKCISHPELKRYSYSMGELQSSQLEIIGNIHEVNNDKL